MRKVNQWISVVLDALPILVGVTGVLHQEWSGRVNVELLAVYTALIGTPALTALRNRPSSQPQQPEQPSGPSSPSSPPSNSDDAA